MEQVIDWFSQLPLWLSIPGVWMSLYVVYFGSRMDSSSSSGSRLAIDAWQAGVAATIETASAGPACHAAVRNAPRLRLAMALAVMPRSLALMG